MHILAPEGIEFLFRWIHFLAGITWIGMLYYFNFVQTPFFAETEPGTRMAMISKLVPRALWWFRWGAMFTFLSGLAILTMKAHSGAGMAVFQSPYGRAILLGAALGTFMWANVWFVIWPAQKVVITSAQQVAGGGQAIPEAAARGRRAALTSRTNVVFSVPMLFYMGAASHFPALTASGGPLPMAVTATLAAIILLVEANALIGTQGATKKPLDSVSGAIHTGLALTVVFYLVFDLML